MRLLVETLTNKITKLLKFDYHILTVSVNYSIENGGKIGEKDMRKNELKNDKLHRKKTME